MARRTPAARGGRSGEAGLPGPRPSPSPPDGLSDAEAVRRARAGDADAFRVLVERHQDRAYGLALRILRDPDRARDAVQEAFLKAWASLGRFQGRSGFYTWLYRLVFNQCIDLRRRDRSGRHVEWDDAAPVSDDAVPDSHAEGDPLRGLYRGELREALAAALESLPDDARRTLVLREIDGLSYAEIAKALEIPKGTVMSRLHHARRRVRAFLVESGALEATPAAPGDADTPDRADSVHGDPT